MSYQASSIYVCQGNSSNNYSIYFLANRQILYLSALMRKKIILIAALLIVLLDFSSCRMREVGVAGNNYFSPRHTRRHYAREKKMNTRHMFWGKHRSGMRPYRHRGQVRY